MKIHPSLKLSFYLATAVLLAFVMSECANPVSPTGGPKDETAPVVVSSKPPNYSSNFSQKEMKVEFDEFIQLKELTQQLLISPPLEYKPEITIKKRSVVIELNKNEKLDANTTYTIFLGNAVVDLNENNPFLNFEYVFSTGDYVDSLSIKGSVKNAFSGLAVENASVMLYADENDTIPLDSLPLKVLPNYVAKTDKKGNFSIHNLKNVPYKIFALNDQNSNYLYDLPYEEIAFLDSMVAPYYTGPRVQPTDSTAVDSTLESQYKYTPTKLFMFSSIDSTQFVDNYGLVADYKIQILLKFPCNQYHINPLNFDPNLDWKIDEPNSRKDSLLFYLKPVVPDTIKLEFWADGAVLDTLEFQVKQSKKPSKKKTRGKNKNAEEEADSLKPIPLNVKNNLTNKVAELNQKFELTFDYPIQEIDSSSFVWIENDTLSFKPKVYFRDSIAKRHLVFDRELTEKVNYKISIPDSAFTNIHGRINDSLSYTFATKTKDKYGNIKLTVIPDQENSQWIIQLLDDKSNLLKEQIITQESEIFFKYMLPATYRLRAIFDKNKNGYWDTGNYAFKRQAEKVIYYEADIELRANWDFEETWNLK